MNKGTGVCRGCPEEAPFRDEEIKRWKAAVPR
jgi:hypothetical protein